MSRGEEGKRALQEGVHPFRDAVRRVVFPLRQAMEPLFRVEALVETLTVDLPLVAFSPFEAMRGDRGRGRPDARAGETRRGAMPHILAPGRPPAGESEAVPLSPVSPEPSQGSLEKSRNTPPEAGSLPRSACDPDTEQAPVFSFRRTGKSTAERLNAAPPKGQAPAHRGQTRGGDALRESCATVGNATGAGSPPAPPGPTMAQVKRILLSSRGTAPERHRQEGLSAGNRDGSSSRGETPRSRRLDGARSTAGSPAKEQSPSEKPLMGFQVLESFADALTDDFLDSHEATQGMSSREMHAQPLSSEHGRHPLSRGVREESARIPLSKGFPVPTAPAPAPPSASGVPEAPSPASEKDGILRLSTDAARAPALSPGKESRTEEALGTPLSPTGSSGGWREFFEDTASAGMDALEAPLREWVQGTSSLSPPGHRRTPGQRGEDSSTPRNESGGLLISPARHDEELMEVGGLEMLDSLATQWFSAHTAPRRRGEGIEGRPSHGGAGGESAASVEREAAPGGVSSPERHALQRVPAGSPEAGNRRPESPQKDRAGGSPKPPEPMDAEALASLINEVLVSQARRHGVDLS